MAYTKIHAITATVDKSINYICNPDKTEGSLYISSYACTPETAAIDFRYTLDHCRENSPNKAYHLIQAFAPGEVSCEEAHQIGIELADQLLKGAYSYLVTTHADKEHPHSHIIFCAADNIEYNKYHDCKKSYYQIRKLSDDLCREHRLSVITPGVERGKTYKEWQANQSNTSWKTNLRRDIDACIKASSTYSEFLSLLRAKGYEIQGETFGEGSRKYITFRLVGQSRAIRGSEKMLSKEYTKERIRKRIEKKEKFQNNPALQQWAEKENLKLAAKLYREVHSLSDLQQKITVTMETGKAAKQSVAKLERQIKELAEQIKYAEQYQENQPYHIAYQKARHPDDYFQKQESRILLYHGAKYMLEQKGIDIKNLNIPMLKARYQELIKAKQELSYTYKNCETEAKKLTRQLETLRQYLGETRQPSPTQDLPGKDIPHSL